MKTNRLIPFAGLLLLPVLPVQGGASVEGTVALPKAPRAASTASRYENKTPAAVAAPQPPVAVVYLEGNFSGAPPATNLITAQVLQQQFQFLPAVLPVQKGTAVEFPNLDDSYHNVFSYSKPKRFDLGRYRKDEKPAPILFDKPGVVKLYCEIHEHMRGTILVLDSPHFTRTDPAGKFRLDQLPAGKYTLKAWLNENRILERVVELQEGAILRVDFAAP